MATAAPITNETYVSLSATFVRRSDPKFVLSFAIPTNSKGLKILCREPVSGGNGGFGQLTPGLLKISEPKIDTFLKCQAVIYANLPRNHHKMVGSATEALKTLDRSPTGEICMDESKTQPTNVPTKPTIRITMLPTD